MISFFRICCLLILLPVLSQAQDTIRTHIKLGNLTQEEIKLSHNLKIVHIYAEGGKLFKEYFLKNGKKIVWQSFLDMTGLVSFQQYKDGKLNGLEVWLHTLDTNLQFVSVEDMQKIYSALDSSYSFSGVVSIAEYKNGLLHGTEKMFASSPPGGVSYATHYANGKKDGVDIGFRRDGTKTFEIYYKDGKQSGLETYYDSNGKIFSECNWINGKRWSLQILSQWHFIRRRIIIANDMQEGISRDFYENGEVKYIDTFKKGKKLNRKMYDENGKQIFSQDYP